MVTTIEMLETAGFTKAVSKAKVAKERSRKLMIAYEHFRFVRQEAIEKFNEKLHAESKNKDGSYKCLSFVPHDQYEEAPPEHVITSLINAKERKCFDRFEVAFIRTVKDPILFGRIEGCTDRFFIDQWDDDVKIQDLIKDNEG